MLAGGWALGVVDTLLAAMLVEGVAANGWALDASAWAGSGTLLLASMVAAAHSRFPWKQVSEKVLVLVRSHGLTVRLGTGHWRLGKRRRAAAGRWLGWRLGDWRCSRPWRLAG